MKVVKSNSTLGKKLLAIGAKYEGMRLPHVYSNYSAAKQAAWNECYNEYRSTDGATDFRICSHNTFQFTCAWFLSDGSMRLVTRDNSYLVVSASF